MFGILYLFAFTVAVQAETDVSNEEYQGWTPISRDEAYNVIEKHLSSKEIGKDGYDFKQNNFMTEKSENNQVVIQEVIGPSYVNYNMDRNERQSYSNRLNETESIKENYGEYVLSNGIYRKPKAISSNSIYAINNLATTNINGLPDNIDNILKGKIINEASVNKYEVTEKTEIAESGSPEIFNILQTNKQNKTKKVNPNNNQFTSILLGILSNYNIRVNDVLSNYEISRQIKRNPLKEEYFLVPVPVRYSSRYNDNFATDPMLVVFLSNYGHLLSRYGRYSNIYGNLASDINNKQPGSYKIYSDTDSSQ